MDDAKSSPVELEGTYESSEDEGMSRDSDVAIIISMFHLTGVVFVRTPSILKRGWGVCGYYFCNSTPLWTDSVLLLLPCGMISCFNLLLLEEACQDHGLYVGECVICSYRQVISVYVQSAGMDSFTFPWLNCKGQNLPWLQQNLSTYPSDVKESAKPPPILVGGTTAPPE